MGLLYNADKLGRWCLSEINNRELTGKVNSAIYRQCWGLSYTASVDVLMEIRYLSKKDYKNWRYERISLCMHSQFEQGVHRYAPDEGLCKKSRIKTIFLLLKAVGYEEDRRLEPQAGTPSSFQQNR